MKIVLVSTWYSENMGYSENTLPKSLAYLGHEVHLITSTAQVYYNSKFYDSTYRKFIGPPILEPVSKQIDGYTLHRLPLKEKLLGIKIEGLIDKVAEIKPDIVQTFDIDGLNTYSLALAQPKFGYKLFTEMHMHASVYPSYQTKKLLRIIKWYWKWGRFLKKINDATVLCYPIAADCADIAKIVFKVPENKLKIQSLGTDTQLFKLITTPLEAEQRKEIRNQFGFTDADIVCVYTGRITKDKSPSVLAEAIKILHQRNETHYKALFVGIGEKEEVEKIKNTPGCVVKNFVPVFDLPKYYQASDIAVWPNQESTSQLDAIACGLPLIINDTVTIKERVEGNGLFYKLMDTKDLANKLLDLKNESIRKEYGEAGVTKAQNQFSWIKIASERVKDYTLLSL